MSDGSAILLTAAGTLVGVVLGVVPSWYFSRRYYLRGGSDLDAALHPLVGNDQKTLQALNAIGRILEQNGQGTFSRDEAGHITGIVITASARDVLSFSQRATAVVVRGEPPQFDRQHEQPPSPEPEGDHA